MKHQTDFNFEVRKAEASIGILRTCSKAKFTDEQIVKMLVEAESNGGTYFDPLAILAALNRNPYDEDKYGANPNPKQEDLSPTGDLLQCVS